jgi:ABC-type antimicrobial peptide transport system permease subunit
MTQSNPGCPIEAVGATPADLVAMVFRESLAHESTGLAVGLLLSTAITRLLYTMIHGVTALDC